MTGKEAIRYIRYCMCEGRLVGNTKPIFDEKWQAGIMAIKALEALKQEPCEDAISRQSVYDELEKWDWQELYLPIHFKENIVDELPSVTPTRPTGHWIYELEDWNKWTCSECGWSKRTDIHVKLGYNYCPNCGADMKEGEE